MNSFIKTNLSNFRQRLTSWQFKRNMSANILLANHDAPIEFFLGYKLVKVHYQFHPINNLNSVKALSEDIIRDTIISFTEKAVKIRNTRIMYKTEKLQSKQ